MDIGLVNKMISTTSLLLLYSIVSTIIIIVLSALYHNCGGMPHIQDNSGLVEENYEIGLFNESISESNTKCNCWELTILEITVITILGVAGLISMIKLTMHMSTWSKKRVTTAKQKKLMKAEKMKKQILEEYGIPAKTEDQEAPGLDPGKEEPV